ncbi:MAG: hypothetical protein ACOX2I_13815 [Candidatus Ozemobacteraceae bacterium]|jgi:hypothetical protein
MARSIRDSLSGFGSELLERIREDSNAWLDEAAFEERVIGIYALARQRDFCSKKDTLKKSKGFLW